MQNTTIEQSVAAIVALALEGKGAEAWEIYYDDAVEKIDLDGIAIQGKPNVVAANHDLLGKITAVRTYEHVGSLVKGDRSFIIWNVDFDVAGVGAIKATEVCIQDWQDGKIIRERFFA